MKFSRKPIVFEAITFDELIAHGIASGAALVCGAPLSFSYAGHPIAHENDDCYLVSNAAGWMKMNRNDMLITGANGEIYPCPLDSFMASYEVEQAPALLTTFKTPLEFAGLTAQQLIRRHILLSAMADGHVPVALIDSTDIDGQYEEADDTHDLAGYLYEFRTSGIKTGLPAPHSRHYEVEQVATRLIGGAWVGWMHWYGGWKHGEPEAVPWFEDATLLEVDEKPVMSVERTFRPAAV